MGRSTLSVFNTGIGVEQPERGTCINELDLTAASFVLLQSSGEMALNCHKLLFNLWAPVEFTLKCCASLILQTLGCDYLNAKLQATVKPPALYCCF